MTPRLSRHFSIFGLVFFVLKSLLGIARQWSLDLTLEPRIHVRILTHRTWAIGKAQSHVKHLTPHLLTQLIDLGPYTHDFAQTLSRKKLMIFRLNTPRWWNYKIR